MALYATRLTHCRGKVFRAGEEIDNIRQASDERLMRAVYGATGDPAAAPQSAPAPASPPPAPPAPRPRRYRTRRLKAQS